MYKFYLIIAGLFGLLFLIFTPPFQAPDEQLHFFRAYEISDGHIIEKKDNASVGDWLPRSLVTTVTELMGDIPKNPDKKITAQKIISFLSLPLNRSDVVFVSFPSTAFYSPVPYLPQVIGISIGKLFNLSPLILMYLGRLVNLIIWIFLVWLSMYLVPVGKRIWFLLALMPMAVFQAASLSADVLTITLSWLVIVLYLRYALANKNESIITGRRALGLIFLSVLLAHAKQSYFLLGFLFLFLPMRKFENKKVYFWFIGGLIVAVLGTSLIWSNLVKDLYLPVKAGVSVNTQMSFIFKNPIHYISILIPSLIHNGVFYLETFAGRRLGWHETVLPWFLVIPYYIILFLSFLWRPIQDKIIVIKQKILFGLTFVAITILIMTSMYLAFTKPGASIIDGVQGRYLIPIAPLFFFLFYGLVGKVNLSSIWGKILRAMVFIYPVFGLIGALYFTIKRYYF